MSRDQTSKERKERRAGVAKNHRGTSLKANEIFKWGKNKDAVFVVTAYPAKGKHVEVYLRTTGGLR